MIHVYIPESKKIITDSYVYSREEKKTSLMIHVYFLTFLLPSTRLIHRCCNAWDPVVKKRPFWSSKKSSTTDMTASSVRYSFTGKFFFMLENRTLSDGAKSGEYGGWSTSEKQQSCTSTIATTDLCALCRDCPGETGLPFIKFPSRLRNVSMTTFQSPENYPCVDLSGRTQRR